MAASHGHAANEKYYLKGDLIATRIAPMMF